MDGKGCEWELGRVGKRERSNGRKWEKRERKRREGRMVPIFCTLVAPLTEQML